MPISGETKNKQSKTLVRGVFVLMPAMLIAKIIGLFYKIPLLSVVGVTGMAYFLSAYHIYALFVCALCRGSSHGAFALRVRKYRGGEEPPGERFGFLSGFFCRWVRFLARFFFSFHR